MGLDEITNGLSDADELLVLAIEEDDAATATEVDRDLRSLESRVESLEFRRMFSGEMDANNAYLDIQSGAGGTEAQDWAEMLLRMYLRWAEAHDFKAEVIEASAGEVAGVKSATVHVVGEYAYGWLRTETGVHRLVRKSPFDSGNRRHTSFASVFVSPEVDDDIDIELDYTKNSSRDYQIFSDFPIQQKESTDWDYDQGSPRKTIRGTAAGGGNRVVIRTINGNVYLKRSR